MNKAMKIIALSILASVIAGGTGASAAGLYADGLRGADHQLLLQVTTYAGTGDMGNVNGRTNAAQFRLPAGIAVKPDGAVLFSDSRNHQIRKIYSGLVTPYAGIYYEMDAKVPDRRAIGRRKRLVAVLRPAGNRDRRARQCIRRGYRQSLDPQNRSVRQRQHDCRGRRSGQGRRAGIQGAFQQSAGCRRRG